MADRPILFSAPMIRAILDGRKTQTRRVLRNQAPEFVKRAYACPDGRFNYVFDSGVGLSDPWWAPNRVGDRLWVRETWRAPPSWNETKPRNMIPCAVSYDADGPQPGRVPRKVRVSIHMPRWASRLTLTVTGVKVERLADISEADAVAEGIAEVRAPDRDGFRYFGVSPFPMTKPTAARAFAMIWESINGEGSWDANPFVAAYTFTVERKNIDA